MSEPTVFFAIMSGKFLSWIRTYVCLL